MDVKVFIILETIFTMLHLKSCSEIVCTEGNNVVIAGLVEVGP